MPPFFSYHCSKSTETAQKSNFVFDTDTSLTRLQFIVTHIPVPLQTWKSPLKKVIKHANNGRMHGEMCCPVQSVWKEAADDSDRNKWKHRILRCHIGAVGWFTTEFLKVMEYLSIWASVRRFCDVTGCMKGRDLDNNDWLIPQWKPTLSIISGSDVVSERSLHGPCWKHLKKSKKAFSHYMNQEIKEVPSYSEK